MSKLSAETLREGIAGDCTGVQLPDVLSLYLLCWEHECRPVQQSILVNAGIFEGSKAKPRKFTETVELQIGLKNYDPQKDKRFSGTVKLPYMPRPSMKVTKQRKNCTTTSRLAGHSPSIHEQQTIIAYNTVASAL